MTYVVLGLVELRAGGVELASPLDARHQGALLGDATFGHTGRGDLFPGVEHRLPK